MKIISFLGTNDYKSTTYHFADQLCETRLFPIALCQFLQPETLLVVVTQQAEAKWFEELKAQLKPLNITPEPVPIPEGHSVEDLWTIFNALTERLDRGDEVVFDITHSFRTLPFLAFLAASFLRVAKDVTLKGIYYGAWEARQPPSQPPLPTDRSPIFDLTPFLSLLEWTISTDDLLKTGDARSLAGQLRATQQMLRTADSVGEAALPSRLKNVAQQMTMVSQAQALARPREVAVTAARVQKTLGEAEAEVTRWAKPFAVLLERVRQDYGRLALSEPESHLQAHLGAQWRLIQWYQRHDQVIAAVTLSREWLVSVVCWQVGARWLEDREDIERTLNGAARLARGKSAEPGPWADALACLPQKSEIVTVWNQLSDHRNDMAHCGMRLAPDPAQKLHDRAGRMHKELRQIAIYLGLAEDRAHDAA